MFSKFLKLKAVILDEIQVNIDPEWIHHFHFYPLPLQRCKTVMVVEG